MACGVAIGHLCGDFIFDALLYVIEIVANFYKVQYARIKGDNGELCTCVCLFYISWGHFTDNNFLGYFSTKNLKNWRTLDKVIKNIKG